MPLREDRILNCEEKDETGLNDFHGLPDLYGMDINKVGINRFRIPLNFRHKDGQIINHDSVASMYVYFPKGKVGINMSRLYVILGEESETGVVNRDFFRKVLARYRSDMRDDEGEELYPYSYLKIKFNYPVKQKSLKTDKMGWQYYKSILEGREDKEGRVKIFLTVYYEYSSTCPCSLSMSKQYERECKEGHGMAVAHSQRSQAKCTVELAGEEDYYVENLVEILRKAIPTETQSYVKRIDEQAFAILNAENPMFVEHAVRRLGKVLNEEKSFCDWLVSVEHWESLHSHNAVAMICKGVDGGLR